MFRSGKWRVSFAAASTLPVAGLTALRTLRLGGLLLGRRVLITGAAGGVGHFAVQMAARSGAHVIGVTGSAERNQGLRDLGATEVVQSIDQVSDLCHLILESVGGASLAAALKLVAAFGTVVTFGNSSRQETTFSVSDFYTHEDARLRAFFLLGPSQSPFDEDLSLLVQLVAGGKLSPGIGREDSWDHLGEAIQAMRNRQVEGKAVLTVGQ